VIGTRAWWIAVAAAGLLGWAFAPLPEPGPALVKPRQDSWRLAELPRRGEDQTSIAALVAGAGYWGRAAAASAAASTPAIDPRWRIAALYGVGSERMVLIQFNAPDKQPQRLRVGDKLPSGHVITSIDEREVCIRIGAKTYRLGVERRES
jgi:hypothetical protein